VIRNNQQSLNLKTRGKTPDVSLFVKNKLNNGIWPRSFALWVTVFYMALVVIRPWEILFPWMAEIHFQRIVALLMITVVVLAKKAKWDFTFQDLSVVLFLGVLALTWQFADNQNLAFDQWYVVLATVIVYFVLRWIVRDTYELTFVLICHIVAMALYLAKAQWDYFVHNAGIMDMGVIRMIGLEYTYGHPNTVAGSIVLTFPIILSLWVLRKDITTTWPSFYKNTFPLFLISYFILAISSIILTNSRMGMVSSLFFVGLATLRTKRIGKKFAALSIGVILIVLIITLMPEESIQRFRTMWDPHAGPASAYASAQGRVEGFLAGIRMFEDSPWVGVGIGNFIEYRVQNLDGVALSAHSLVGQLLGENGIFGGIAFTIMILSTLVTIRHLRKATLKQEDISEKVLYNYSLAFREIIILLIFGGLTAHNLYRFRWIWVAAFAVIGLSIAKRMIKNRLSNRNRSKTGEGLVSANS